MDYSDYLAKVTNPKTTATANTAAATDASDVYNAAVANAQAAQSAAAGAIPAAENAYGAEPTAQTNVTTDGGRTGRRIDDLYNQALKAQQAAIDADYIGTEQRYDWQAQQLKDQYEAELLRQAVENQKEQRNWNEVQTAYGLSSGTMGQAYLARQNQAQAAASAAQASRDRALQQVAMEKEIAKQKYQAELRAAIAENNYQKAKEIYEKGISGSGSGSTNGSGRHYVAYGNNTGGGTSGKTGDTSTSSSYKTSSKTTDKTTDETARQYGDGMDTMSYQNVLQAAINATRNGDYTAAKNFYNNNYEAMTEEQRERLLNALISSGYPVN